MANKKALAVTSKALNQKLTCHLSPLSDVIMYIPSINRAICMRRHVRGLFIPIIMPAKKPEKTGCVESQQLIVVSTLNCLVKCLSTTASSVVGVSKKPSLNVSNDRLLFTTPSPMTKWLYYQVGYLRQINK
eukprot:scaffold597841_cov24-Prasinocladus_malaysianus.AAC.1